MKTSSFTVSLFAILLCLAGTPAAAQQRGFERPAQLHAVNPSMSLTAPTNSPLQDQMRQDYATGLWGRSASCCNRTRPVSADRSRR